VYVLYVYTVYVLYVYMDISEHAHEL